MSVTIAYYQYNNNNIAALCFAGYSHPLIICCHGPGKGWIMDHALVTLIVINLSAVMTHVSDTVKLWSALSLLCLQISSFAFAFCI